MGRGWLDLRLRCGGAVALLALSGCGDPAPQKAPAAPGTGVTIELPEPVPGPGSAAPLAQPAEAVEPKGPAADEPTAAATTEQIKKTPPLAPVPQPEPPSKAPAAAEPDLAPAPSASSAGPPLPKAVIARTLDRIGFRCGSVTSTARIEGSDDPSAYRVRCSSGQTYRASARSGRYRFTELKSE
jgi:hypothetical protein